MMLARLAFSLPILIPVVGSASAMGTSEWQLEDPMNDWGVEDNHDLYVATPASDILRAGFSENETDLIFRIQFQDLNSLDSTDSYLNYGVIFGLRNPATGEKEHGYKLDGIYMPVLPPVIGGRRELDLHFYHDNASTVYRLRGTVDSATSTITSILPKANISDVRAKAGLTATLGPGWEIFNLWIFAGEGVCAPFDLDRWLCTGIGGNAQTLRIDWAPHSGIGPVGRGDPFPLFWSRNSPPDATVKQDPGPGQSVGNTPGFTALALWLGVGTAWRVVRRPSE